MKDRTCLITGANRGIGKAAALELAAAGARLVLVCRDRAAGEAAREEIRASAGDRPVELLLADLSRLESVRALAEEVRSRCDALHVLVNNAGVLLHEREVDERGVERTFAVNHLAAFLLTRELEGLLRESAPARVVTVSSEAHRRARWDPADLQLERGWGGRRAYANSKLANLYFTFELARRLGSCGVTANALHPGVIRTGLFDDYVRDTSFLVRALATPFKFLAASARDGGHAVARLAADPELEGVSGRYFKCLRETNSSRVSYDRDQWAGLWEDSRRLTS